MKLNIFAVSSAILVLNLMLHVRLVSQGCLLVRAMEDLLIQRLHIQTSWKEMMLLSSRAIWKPIQTSWKEMMLLSSRAIWKPRCVNNKVNKIHSTIKRLSIAMLGHCFIWQLLIATFCQLVYHINVAYSADCPYRIE